METNIGAIKSCTHKHSINHILNNKPPYVFEGGNQTRDFIRVKDIAKAQKLLNFKPKITLQEGLPELAEWAKTHGWDTVDHFEKALKELGEKHPAT